MLFAITQNPRDCDFGWFPTRIIQNNIANVSRFLTSGNKRYKKGQEIEYNLNHCFCLMGGLTYEGSAAGDHG